MTHRTEAEERTYQDGYRAACRNTTPGPYAADIERALIGRLKERARARPERTITLEELEDFDVAGSRMICGEHEVPEDQCREFKHVADESDPVARAYVRGLARGIELAVDAGEPREREIRALLRYIRERL